MSRGHLLLLALSPWLLAVQSAQNPLPNSELKDPDGQRVQFKFQTLPNSVQVYTCRQTNQGFAWAGPDPDATLTNAEKTLTLHHYKGPTWEAPDGSIVRSDGTLAKHFLPNDKNAVHWLELPATESTKQFRNVKFVRRVETAGGLAPSDKPCDAQHSGEQARVNYAAIYLFYVDK